MNLTHEAIVDVLRAHARQLGIRDLKTHCLCGWTSTEAHRLGGVGEHVVHQADAILAAFHVEGGRK